MLSNTPSRFAPKPRRSERTRIPSDWAPRLLRVRRELGLTQARLAAKIGAASKAVVYQWESRKRGVYRGSMITFKPTATNTWRPSSAKRLCPSRAYQMAFLTP